MAIFKKKDKKETEQSFSDDIIESADENTPAVIVQEVEDTTYKIGQKLYPGYVYDSSNSGHVTGLQQVLSALGATYPAHCVDYNNLIDHDETYRIATQQQIGELFPPDLVKRLRWMINHSYPMISDLAAIDSLAGTSGITIQDTVNATQGAIWSITNSADFIFGREGTSNNSNVIKLHDYLLNGSVPGWELSDVTAFGDSISIYFDINEMKQNSLDNDYIYGPLQLISNDFFTKHLNFPLTSSNNKVKFCSVTGTEISSALPNTDFYFKAPKNEDIGRIGLSTFATVTYGSDFHIIFCVNGKSASQACGFYEYLSKNVSANTDICLCKLIVKKIGDGDCCNMLYGGVVEFYTEEGVLLDTKTSDEVGSIYFYNLLKGQYVLNEITAPDGYILPFESFPVYVKYPSKVFTINNRKKNCRIKVVKYDRHYPDKLLSGAEFDIFNSEGKLVGNVKTNDEGVGVSEMLPDGFYKLVETKAPRGYYLYSTPITVSLDYPCECPKGYKTVYICNVKEKKKGRIKIIKTDKECDKKRLSNAVFEIKNKKGELVDTVKTDSDGIAVSKFLDYGEYIIAETKAPKGYYLNTKHIKADICKKEITKFIKNKKKKCGDGCDCDRDCDRTAIMTVTVTAIAAKDAIRTATIFSD